MRVAMAFVLALSTLLAGCFGEGETIVESQEETPIWLDYEMVDTIPAISPWEFTTIDLNLNESTSTNMGCIQQGLRRKLL